MKAFIFDPLWNELSSDSLIATLNNSGLEYEISTDVKPLNQTPELYDSNEEKLLCVNPDYVGWKLTAEDFIGIPNLKAILTASTSFGWIDTASASQQGIPVCNIRGFSAQAVAEWAVLTAFNLARQIPCLIKEDFPLDFDKDYMKYRGVELQGKTAAVIGLGTIGQSIAKRCAGLGMNVIYWSQNSRSDQFTYSELDDLFAQADVIFPSMAINDGTKQIFTDERIKSLKPTAIFVDVTEIVDSNRILPMINSKKLFGYGFEAPPKSFAKYTGNVWAAPAYAWTTDASMYTSVELWVENMVNAAAGEFPNKVN